MTTLPHLNHHNVIDADGHILEPPDTWEKYIDPKFRDRAIRVRINNEGQEYLELDGRPSKFFNMKAFTLLGGMGRKAEEIAASMKMTYKTSAPFGSMDPKERVQLLDQDGLRATILYPSIGLTWECEIEDPELSLAYARAYNRWIVDFCSDSNGRLVPLSETARKNLLGDSVAQVYGL